MRESTVVAKLFVHRKNGIVVLTVGGYLSGRNISYITT